MLLEPDLRARLDRLSLQTRGRVRGLWSGRHASVRLGESLDFADYREYAPGDDFRRIDHHLWARLGVVLVRRYEAEEELTLRLALDCSASMAYEDKLPVARKLCAILAYLALAGGDRVRPALVPGIGDAPVEWGPGARHLSSWPALERWLETAAPRGSADLAAAAGRIARPGTVRGPVVLVSDLLADGWEQAVDALGVAGGGAILQVMGPGELDPALAGDLELVDAESGVRVPFSASADSLTRYQERLEGFLDEVARRARRAGLDHVLVPAIPGAEERALSALAAAGAVR